MKTFALLAKQIKHLGLIRRANRERRVKNKSGKVVRIERRNQT